MAGDWIKMRGNLWDDPRVSKLCDMTDQGEAAIVGALYWLWATADQHTEDGLMPGLTLRQIDRKTGIQGFGAALCEIGWLADNADGVRIINFEEHNGTSAKRRCTDAQRKANVRSVSASDADKPKTDEGQKTPTLGAREREEKEEEKREEKRERVQSPTGSRLPADWVMTDDMESFCKTERPDLNPADVACRFADYWQSMAGAKARKTDWIKTWRNWVRNEKKAPTSASNQAETPYQRSMRLRMQEAAPGSARKDPSKPVENVIDFFAIEVPVKRLEIENGPAALLG
jgi:hypothetical protein